MAAVLVVDDEEGVRSFVADALSRADHDVRAAASGEEALAVLHEDSFALVITDLKMPGMSGLELLKAAKAAQPGSSPAL